MKEDYDFKNAKKGPVLSRVGKIRLTIMLDEDIVDAFRARAESSGKGYQTMINEALRTSLNPENAPVTEANLKKVIDRALQKVSRRTARID